MILYWVYRKFYIIEFEYIVKYLYFKTILDKYFKEK